MSETEARRRLLANLLRSVPQTDDVALDGRAIDRRPLSIGCHPWNQIPKTHIRAT